VSGDLGRRVRGLEGRAAERRYVRAESWGITWATEHVPLGRPLRAGEYLVVDLHEGELCGGTVRLARTVERATTHERDRGRVYNAAGEEIGWRRAPGVYTCEVEAEG